ncbi:MAG: acetyl-CoA carboxylase biotin carboxyl carrier protein [Chlamydiota bacterium]|nr:acetyl-CoA carboxylase biotin carboxyl carrier protein [Chlamydiota bacterium]
MELKHIKELMAAMGRTGLKKLLVKKEDFELQLEREGDETIKIIEPSREYIENREEKQLKRADAAFSKGGSRSTTPPSSHAKSATDDKKHEDTEQVSYKSVKSPMVGTFYSSPSPDEPPFVKVGDKISPDSVVCIIEAMKVMNEVKAGVSGTVKEVLVENGHPVEFGSALLIID